MVGDEPFAPYQRPPLSKKYFAGEVPRERLLLRPEAFYAEKGVALELGHRVEELDAAARTLRLDDGRSLRYDRLLLATGSRVRKLEVPGVVACRRAPRANDRRHRRDQRVAAAGRARSW